MMIVKILPVQIPVFWDSIKFCAVTADEVDKAYQATYLNELLQALLSDKAQCFVRLDDKRILVALMITRITTSKITNEKSLFIQVLYSIKNVASNEWQTDYSFLTNFATVQKCRSITFDTRHKEVMELGRLVGFEEVQRSFEFVLDPGRF